MKRFLLTAILLMSFLIGSLNSARAARETAPEIKEYLEGVKDKRKEEAKKERGQRRADPYRKLRPYQTLEEINAELDKILEEHPDVFTGGTYGKSVEGRDLRWLRLNTGAGNKPQVLISGNIHAQELAGGQMVMSAIRYFADNYGKDCKATSLADAADLYFIPVLNPDRMEHAALAQAKYGITGFIRKNVGEVDLNRNYPYPKDAPQKLKNSAGSPKRRSQTHRGPAPFSEPETRALIGFIEAHDFLLSLNYHTSGGMIMYCPGTYPDPVADTDLMREIALSYQDTMFDKYSVHPEIDLYPTIGALDDYLYHRYGILSLTIEVGKDNEKKALVPRNGSVSPIFWMYNVYYLERERANNLPGILVLIDRAIKISREPELIKWEPSAELWEGEPPRN